MFFLWFWWSANGTFSVTAALNIRTRFLHCESHFAGPRAGLTEAWTVEYMDWCSIFFVRFSLSVIDWFHCYSVLEWWRIFCTVKSPKGALDITASGMVIGIGGASAAVPVFNVRSF